MMIPESEMEGEAVIDSITEKKEENAQEDNLEPVPEEVEPEIDLEQRASPTARPQSRGSVSTTKKVARCHNYIYAINFSYQYHNLYLKYSIKKF